jgi:hypothetical protein
MFMLVEVLGENDSNINRRCSPGKILALASETRAISPQSYLILVRGKVGMLRLITYPWKYQPIF